MMGILWVIGGIRSSYDLALPTQPYSPPEMKSIFSNHLTNEVLPDITPSSLVITVISLASISPFICLITAGAYWNRSQLSHLDEKNEAFLY
jgi:hypothetical protein